jgi:hypothetical protein
MIKLDLKKRSSLDNKVVTDVLKSLSSAHLVKSVSWPQFKKEKVWVLYDNYDLEEKQQEQIDKV